MVCQLCLLVVDDDIAACLVLQRMVQQLGFDCDIAHDGEDAVKAASAKDYSAILLDSFMPVKNGWDTALDIRALKNGVGDERPVMIGMVSLDSPSLRQNWRMAGMELENLLPKPINRSDLRKTICREVHMNPQEKIN
jgi:CheY-like chemotaxis protein